MNAKTTAMLATGFAVASLATPAVANESYLLAGDATTATFPPERNFTFFPQGATITKTGFSGSRRLDLNPGARFSGGFANRVNVQVTALGTAGGFLNADRSAGGGFCNFTTDALRPNSMTVRCFKGDGTGQHTRRALVYLAQPTDDSLDAMAFALLHRPTAASYTVPPRFSFGRGSKRVTRTGVGRYRVHLGPVASREATVQVSAMSSQAVHCNASSWGAGSVRIACFGLDGLPRDAAASVLVLNRRHPGLSFVWNNNLMGGLPMASYAHASDLAPQNVTWLGPGRYRVRLGPEAGPGGHVQVTAYGTNAYCTAGPTSSVDRIWDGRNVIVRCANNGVPVNSRFTVMALRRMQTFGIGTEGRFGGAHARDAFICPQAVVGDRDFGGAIGGNGATVSATYSVSIVGARRDRLALNVVFSATERNGGDTRTTARRNILLGRAPIGMEFFQIVTPAPGFNPQTMTFESLGSSAWGEDLRTLRDSSSGAIVREAVMVGDTGGSDVSTDADCSNDTRLQRFTLNPVRIGVRAR